MFYPTMMYPFLAPILPTNCDLPPTLYAIMNSKANFDSEVKTKIKDLASVTHSDIFDFNYPLTNKINKDEFEIMILNKFIMRRIGFDTFTAFQIALNVKLNEIMPIYNKMFDMLDGWDLFNDGEITTRTLNENKQKVDVNNGSMSSTANSTINSTNSSTDTSDRRFSNTPQNAINDVKSGEYVTEYNFDTNTGSSTDSTTNATTNSSTTTNTNNVNDNSIVTERIERTPTDKINIYKQFLENKNSIYSMIFKDLDCLFYGLV